MMVYFLIFFVACFLLTGGARRYALWRHALSIPEFRHHHLDPVPRGGGIALSVTTIALNLVMYRYHLIDIGVARSLCFSGLFLLITCLVHDVRPLSRRLRLSLQFAAAALALVWYDRDLIIIFFDSYLYLNHWWLSGLVIWLVWLINVNNAMNDVDGLVASQAFIMVFASACLLAISGNMDWAVPLILICAPILGFLAWNWPPARITMGDGGSSFLGLFIAVLGLFLAADTDLNLWVWLILMAPFVVDSGCTLMCRWQAGESISPSSHKTHVYQLLASRWDSHFYVTLLLWVIDWLWLFPFAYLAMNNERWGGVFVTTAYFPLLVIAWFVRRRELSNK